MSWSFTARCRAALAGLAALAILLAGCGRQDPPATVPADSTIQATPDSIAVLSLLWDKHPGHVPVAQRLAQLCEQQGKTEQALDWWLEARAADSPDNRAPYWLDLARLYHDLGQDERAAAALDSLLAERPAWPEALYNRGALCVNTGDPQGARRLWQRMLVLAPQHPMAERVRAWLEANP
jgi:tetratricopeptide (TPR) repeat protein